MTLLLLFGSASEEPSVLFRGTLNFSLAGTVSLEPAAVSFEAAVIQFDATPHVDVLVKTAFAPTVTLEPTSTAVVSWPSVSFEGRATFTPTIVPRGKKKRAVVVDAFGTPYGELENAKIGAITFELNDAGEEFSAVIPIDDPKAELVLSEWMRELQVWRGDQLLAWGPMMRPAADKKWLAITARGAAWHLTRRHIGKAERTNYVKNGDFEDGLAHWSFVSSIYQRTYDLPGAQPTPPIHSIAKFPTVTGKRSLHLENYVAETDSFAAQFFEWTVDEELSPDGDRWTLKGFVYVERFDAPATEGGRGLYLERFSTTEPHPDPTVLAIDPNAKKSIEHVFVPIDEETPVGVWHRMEIGLETPPKAGEPEVVNVRLYAPDGVVKWDAISLTLEERLAFYAKDQTSEIAKGIVEHLQSADYDKSDANLSTDCAPSGVLRDRVYVHSEHPNGFDSIDEFSELSNGFDFAVRYTPTERIFTTYFPERGRHWPRFALELGKNLADFAWSLDGEAASSSIVVLGQGDGSDREEGFAIDPTAFAGGLTLEQVFAAPPETPIDSLDNLAAERLILSREPEVLALKTLPPKPGQPDPVGILYPGDTIPVRIRRGAFLLEGIYRIGRLTITPDDTLELVVNRRELTP